MFSVIMGKSKSTGLDLTQKCFVSGTSGIYRKVNIVNYDTLASETIDLGSVMGTASASPTLIKSDSNYIYISFAQNWAGVVTINRNTKEVQRVSSNNFPNANYHFDINNDYLTQCTSYSSATSYRISVLQKSNMFNTNFWRSFGGSNYKGPAVTIMGDNIYWGNLQITKSAIATPLSLATAILNTATTFLFNDGSNIFALGATDYLTVFDDNLTPVSGYPALTSSPLRGICDSNNIYIVGSTNLFIIDRITKVLTTNSLGRGTDITQDDSRIYIGNGTTINRIEKSSLTSAPTAITLTAASNTVLHLTN